MSWIGQTRTEIQDWEEVKVSIEQRLRQAGLAHMDMRPKNAIWSEENQRWMAIYLDQSKAVSPTSQIGKRRRDRRVLQPRSPNAIRERPAASHPDAFSDTELSLYYVSSYDQKSKRHSSAKNFQRDMSNSAKWRAPRETLLDQVASSGFPPSISCTGLPSASLCPILSHCPKVSGISAMLPCA